jgi:hypothetical protein
MAHTFGKNSTRTSSAGNPISAAAFSIVAGETVLVLMMKINGGTARAGGSPVFGGLTMTQASTAQFAAATPEAGAELWYLLNPPIGSWVCVIPNTGGLTIFYTLATGKAVSGGKSAFDGANGANNTAANPSPGAVSCSQPGDIGFAVCGTGAQTWAPSAQAGTNIANTDDGAHGGGEQYILQATIASVTLGWTFATSDDFGAVAAFFKEVAPPAMNNYMGFEAGSGISVVEKIR